MSCLARNCSRIAQISSSFRASYRRNFRWLPLRDYEGGEARYGRHTGNTLHVFHSTREKDRTQLHSSHGLGLAIRRYSTKNERETYDSASAWNVANGVTIGRIVAAPLTGYWILTGDYDMALGGLVYAGVSDWLDGFLARRLRLRTVVGSYLDPAADKLLISTTTMCLAYQEIIPPWLAVLIVGRDVALIVGWAALLKGKTDSFNIAKVYRVGGTSALEPFFISKLNTAMQISLSVAAVICAAEWRLIDASLVHGLGIATALTTTTSGLSYGLEFLKRRRGR